jgi:hypothetical protein
MSRKPDFLWCFLLTVGVAAVGCSSDTMRGSVAENLSADNSTSPYAAKEGSPATDAADMTLVSLDLPGMT